MHWPTASYHPQANATEAANKTILNAIRCYIKGKDGHRDWNLQLPSIACAMNTSIHTSTKFSPYATSFGQDMPTAGNRHYSDTTAAATHDKLSIIREKIKTNLLKSYEHGKNNYDLRAKARIIDYKVGDVVWKRNTQLSSAGDYYSAKLAPRYTECRVAAKIGTNTYTLKDLNGKVIGNFSTADLRQN